MVERGSDQALSDPRRIRIGLFAEVNMNLIDGSSVWVQSVAQMLAEDPHTEVELLLRFPEEREVLTAPLREHQRIEVVEPPDGRETRLSPQEAIEALEERDAERPFDLVLLRGTEVSAAAGRGGAFAGRLWVYYLPPLASDPLEEGAYLELLAGACERILCQTEPIRSLAEAAIANQAEKLILLPPMIPPPPRPAVEVGRSGPLKLFYAGKFAPEYSFLEMVAMFEELRAEVPDAEFHLVGDKLHDPPQDPGFKPAAESVLAGTENLVWHGGIPREQVASLLADADVALSLRHAGMARSKELSTKVLEYGAAGCAVLLNRTPLYEELLGSDYPLFADDPAEARSALVGLHADRPLLVEAEARCRRAALDFTFPMVRTLLEPYLSGREPAPQAARRTPTVRLLFAGHDLKFLGRIPERSRLGGAEIREDHWKSHSRHSEPDSTELNGWADTVMCEWCLGNAVWYSRNKRDGQRLVVRYHRMERETTFPESVEMEQVDRMVFVGPHLLEEAAERFGWPQEVLQVVPNAVDTHALQRRKLPGSSFNLGLIGYVPSRKRFDRALDLLELLRAHDPRYRLIVKGQPATAHDWIMRREEEREYFQEIERRIASSPLLGEAVSFESFGRNIPAFLRKIGVILSTSDHEGHQVALAEGMASGAVPIVIERPGAREQYTDDWVHDTPQQAATALLELAGAGGVEEEGARAARYAERWSLEAIMPLWDEVLGLDHARELGSHSGRSV